MKYRGERVVSRTEILEPEIQETMDERWSDIEDNEGRNIEHGLSFELEKAMDVERVEVQTAIQEALSVSNWLFGETATIQWAEGFTFDRKQIARDE